MCNFDLQFTMYNLQFAVWRKKLYFVNGTLYMRLIHL